jgi:hypothetical protein
MTRNPYEPPNAPISDSQPLDVAPHGGVGTLTLFTTPQIFLASFLGSPLAAAWFAVANFRALGKPEQARQTLVRSVIATMLVLALASVLPEGTPNILLPLVYSFAIRAMADAQFGAVLREHAAAGGKKGSWWLVVGVSFAICLVLLALIFGVIYALVVAGVIAE